ncbi:MAG: DinB family protein [Acidimicrobiales bacterium]|nr:DinB family protein [Acidimicrobiales bacterium]
MAIVPDDKDWTWVLVERCPECGFDASDLDPAAVAPLVRDCARDWATLHAEGGITATRPDPATWSPLEYACHVRDVFLRFDARTASMLDTDDPLFENWDQDATAVEDRYAEQDPDAVVPALVAAAAAMAARLDAVTDDQWERPGRRSNGSVFTVDTLARYMIHDPIHHLWDVSGRP